MEKTTELEQTLAMALSLSTLDKVRLVEQIMATLERDLAQDVQPQEVQPSDNRPSPELYASWAGVNISEEDIAEVRREMWANFPREDV